MYILEYFGIFLFLPNKFFKCKKDIAMKKLNRSAGAEAPNIAIAYCYRDYDNHKREGIAIFTNPYQLSQSLTLSIIRNRLENGLWFIAQNWQLPDLHFTDWNERADHLYHEFTDLFATHQPSNHYQPLHDWLATVCERHNADFYDGDDGLKLNHHHDYLRSPRVQQLFLSPEKWVSC
jgi:hypothetical protein